MFGRRLARFTTEERGAVLIEALIVFPLLTVMSFAFLEFGNMMWERQQMQAGVRDAARYWSRCRPATTTFASTCDEATARNIAFYGNPAGTGSPRVPGWTTAAQITITPSKATLPSYPVATDLVRVSGTTTYIGSPAFGAFMTSGVTISASTEMRSIGW